MRRLIRHLALLCACSSSAFADDLVFYNWNDYIAPEVLTEFSQQTGIKVDYRTYSTSQELQALMKQGGRADLVVPSQDTLGLLIGQNKLQPLKHGQLPNRQHLDRELLAKLAAFDRGNRFAVPYLWGAVGMAVNQPQVEQVLGQSPADSWTLVFDPANAAKLSQCGMSLLDSDTDILNIVTNLQGRSLDRASDRRIKRAADLVASTRPYLRYIDSEAYIDDLNSGRLCVAVAWIGDALGAAAADQPVRFVIPEEGSVMFIDSLVIPAQAQQVDAAHQLINYLMQPEVIARITAETYYPNANTASHAHLPAEMRDDPSLNLDSGLKRRLFTPATLSEERNAMIHQLWSDMLNAPLAPTAASAVQ